MDKQVSWPQLMDGLRNGDALSGRRFWENYGPVLQRLADKHLAAWLRRRVEPEDVVQSACRTFLRHLQNGEYRLGGEADLLALLCAITLNKVLMKARFHRAQRRDLRREAATTLDAGEHDVLADLAAHEPSPADAAEFAEQFKNFLAMLDDEERRMLELKLQGFSSQEIADRLKRTDRWVRKLLERVRHQLVRELKEA